MVIFMARHNLANLNEVKINLIVKFANLAGKSYNIPALQNIATSIVISLKSHKPSKQYENIIIA